MNRNGQPVPAPNLLPQSRITARLRDGAIRFWIFTLVGIVILGAIPAAMLSIHLRTSKPVNNEHVTRFVSDLEQLRAALPPLQKELADLQTASKSLKLSKARVHWTDLIDYLSSLTDESVRIHAFNAAINTTASSQTIEVTIEVRTKSLSKAREFLVTVESSGLFDEVDMIESRRLSSNQDSLVNSTIRGKIFSDLPAGATP